MVDPYPAWRISFDGGKDSQVVGQALEKGPDPFELARFKFVDHLPHPFTQFGDLRSSLISLQILESSLVFLGISYLSCGLYLISDNIPLVPHFE